MVPFWGFSLIAIMIHSIINSPSLIQILKLGAIVLMGNIRNVFIAGSLWFLSCLFLMEIIFKIIKYLKYKWLILLVCLLAYVIAQEVITPRPIVRPHWFYNLDSVFYYIIFFALGYILYPYIIELFKLDKLSKKIMFLISTILVIIYALILFDGKNIIVLLLDKVPFVSMFIPIITAFLLIWLNLVLAKIFENISYFSKIGSETLYLCGNEYVVKTMIPCILEIFSLKISFPTPLHVYIYTLLLLIITTEFLIPYEKKFL